MAWAVVLVLALARCAPDLQVLFELHLNTIAAHEHHEAQHQEHHHGDADDQHHGDEGTCHHQTHCCCSHGQTTLALEDSTPGLDIETRPGRSREDLITVTPSDHTFFHPPLA